MGYFEDQFEEQDEREERDSLDDFEEELEEEDEDTIQELEVDERGHPRIRREDYDEGDLD